MTKATVREALNLALKESMIDDSDVFILGEEVAEYNGAYKITQGLLDTFGPKRVIDSPITEHGFAGLGVGAAFGGLRPVIEFMTFNFAMQAIDQIINSAAKTCYMSGGTISCPIVFRGPNGAAARVGAQHSQNYANWYGNIPGLKVISPFDSQSAYELLKQAIKDNNPVIFLENEILYGQSFDFDPNISTTEIGKAHVIKEGADLTLVSYSLQLKYALEASSILEEKHGIQVEIIDLRTIRPLDYETIIKSVKKTNNLTIVDEGWPFASVASSISHNVQKEAFDYLDSPIECVNAKDVPLPYAQNLEKLALPSTLEIVEVVLKQLNKI
jgi:pyruvate dehydrogenase E1 component beta subunit